MPKSSRLTFQKLLALSLLILSLNSCDPGCVEPYAFDTESTYVNAKPTSDGIFGKDYDDVNGGQTAGWHDTGLRSDGSQLILEITGAWTAWDDAGTEAQLKQIDRCNLCAKRVGLASGNCICDVGQTPVSEKDSQGNSLNHDCTIAANQNDPTKCTCTQQQGSVVNNPNVYFFALNYQTKDEVLKVADEQTSCKFDKGVGLYAGIFGRDGHTIPTRIYHLYPTQEICDVPRNAEGKCIGAGGEDRAKYIYKSPNDKVFIKNDLAGNDGSDTNPSDDEYHKGGEYLKLIISDRYYSDNFGGYNVNFMGGFLKSIDSGLFEYIVGTVEDSLLGKVASTGKREGGAIAFLYNSIVKDSTFILIVQLCLIMYIVIFGIWVLSGSLELSKKELTKRIIKISLVIFFTTETSWYFYNQLVVGLFKDGMDAVITIFMTASDKTIDTSSLVVTSQLDRANSLSHATRFSYVDVIIKKLFSDGTSKKILSLFFSDFFGILYIFAIYVLIVVFVFVMLTAAFMYVQILLGLVFVLCLGPIFMITVLFDKTDEIFKRWISYMASQSLQIVCLFLILYLFSVMIDKGFNDLLYYKVCTENINFGLFNINFLKTQGLDRSIATWFIMFVKIGTLLFLLKIIMDQIPGFVGQLVSVSGQKADTGQSFLSGTNTYASSIAGDLFGKARGAVGAAYNKVPFSSSDVRGVAKSISRSLGVNAAVNAVGNATGVNYLRSKSPFRNPVSMYYDRQIDSMIKSQRQPGSSDAVIRSKVLDEARKKGFSDESILRRLDQKLVQEPVQKVIKDEIKNIKNTNPSLLLDKDATNKRLQSVIKSWASQKSSLDPSAFAGLVDKYGSLINEKGALTSSEASKAFAGNKLAQDQYLAHLKKEIEARKDAMDKEKWYQGISKLSRLGTNIRGKAAYNPHRTAANFLAKVGAKEKLDNSITVKDYLKNYAGQLATTSALNRRALNSQYYLDEVYKKEQEDYSKIASDLAATNAKYEEDRKAAGFALPPELQADKASEKQAMDADFSNAKSSIDNSAEEKAKAAALKAAVAKYKLGQAKLNLYYVKAELDQINAIPAADLTASQKARKARLEQDQSSLEREASDAEKEAESS